MNYFFVVNPKSANGKTEKMWETIILPILKEKNIEFEFKFSEWIGHATEIANSAVKELGFNNIIAVGGDGTNHEVINGIVNDQGLLYNKDTKMGLICSGTGSDFIKTLKIPKDPSSALDVILNGNIKRIDLIRGDCVSIVDESPTSEICINVCSLALGGDIVHKTNNMTKIFGGKATFMIASLNCLLKHKFYKIRYRKDTENDWTEMNLNVGFFGNGEYNGGGMHPLASAKIDDGLFDTFLIRDYKRMKLIGLLQKIYGEEEELIEFRKSDDRLSYYEKCEKFEIESLDERDILIDFDGEVVGKLPLTLKILPSRLDFFVP